jgi:hypothetical protein
MRIVNPRRGRCSQYSLIHESKWCDTAKRAARDRVAASRPGMHDRSMVTNEPVSSQPGPASEAEADDVSRAVARELVRAICRLSNDPTWLTAAFLEFLHSVRPVEPNRLTKAQKRYLIQSGAFTEEGLAEAEASVDRGSLQLDVIRGWLIHLLDTNSLDETAGYLGMAEGEVVDLLEEGRLYAANVHGRFRFPNWQFDVSKPGKVLPHLPEVIQAARPDWHSQSLAAFMATPQEDLVAEGRKTPTAWLRDGGDVQDVIDLIELDRLW